MNDEEQKYDILAVPSNRAFVVASDKVEEFKNSKPDLEKRRLMEECVSKLNIKDKTRVKKIGSLKK